MQEAAAGFEAFVAVSEAGSISAAARELGMPRETLSRQLAQLEERLGTRLLHRGTRTLTLTPAGRALLERARPVVLAAREAEASVRALDGVPRGLLRVGIPPSSGSTLFGGLFSAFLLSYPQVELEVFSSSRFVDLVGEGIDVVLRAGTVRTPGLVSRRLWSSELIAVATPGYLETHGVPRVPADLIGHQCLLGMTEGVRTMQAWPTWDGGTVPVQGRLASNDMGLLLTSALAGLGIALLPRPMVRPLLESGQLSQVLGSGVGIETSVSLVFVERHLMAPRLRAFINHTTRWFEAWSPATDGMAPLGALAQWVPMAPRT